MALQPFCCLSNMQFLLPTLSPKHCSSRPTIKCLSMSTGTVSNSGTQSAIKRRSGNYAPSIRDDNYIQSLKSDYVGALYEHRANELKAEVRVMIDHVVGHLQELELIDILQRLGLSYHFENEIDKILASIYNNGDFLKEKHNDLYVTALGFRLLRQHGYNIPQGVFSSFMNESGNFKESIHEDIKGILSLYEASYYLEEGESILEKARDFATKHLQDYVDNHKIHKSIDDHEIVSHALELPLHWKIPRLESRWFIDVYEKRQDKINVLLELAKLDYNMVQAIHQEDLKQASRWWKSTGFVENLSFARDRITENYLWSVGMTPEPQFRNARIMAAKFNSLITVIDDVYDVYGTLEELKLFTEFVEKWDAKSMKQLPGYMKICARVLHNFVNEMASLVSLGTEEMDDIVSHIRKVWAGLCKTYMVEAEWYHSGYTPKLQEYLDNAWISISGPVMLVQEYFLTANPVTKEAIECLEQHHNMIRWPSMILRLSDDLGTSSEELKRGDNPKSIQCYMYETGASEEDARAHIKHLISATWKKMNKDRVADSPFSRDFIRIGMNLARMSQFMYQHGDGHASQDHVTDDRIQSVLVQPIPL